MKKGPYKILSSKTVYKNPWIKVIEEKVEKDGKEGVFGVIDYGKGISVVALNEKRDIYLVREYYYAIESYGLQTPSGAINKNETPLEAAKRELLEESGLTSDKWIELGMVHPLTMALRSPAYLFLALDVKKQAKGEVVEVVTMPFDKACEMVLKSEINHAPSCIAILKANIWLEENPQL